MALAQLQRRKEHLDASRSSSQSLLRECCLFPKERPVRNPMQANQRMSERSYANSPPAAVESDAVVSAIGVGGPRHLLL